MDCSACGNANRDGAAFCGRCGATLAVDVRCSSCGASNPSTNVFCEACGAAVAGPAPREYTPSHLADKIISESRGLAGERRTVSVLFADAVGSTPIGERLDAEDVYGLMQGCVRHMLDSVHRYEGHVVQFRGDGIMALFGAPIAHEDAARRAVAAGLEMQEALTVYAQEVRGRGGAWETIDCQFRVGVNTGPVVVGGIGDDLHMDFTAIGDTVNLAARMESSAEPGTVYMTEPTFRSVEDYIDCAPVGELIVKGKTDPVRAYRAVAQKTVRSRFEASVARGLSPFVGRDRDLRMLQSFWQEALAGRGQIVLISGAPGIGKSRLLLEFQRSLDDDVIWREAHCVSYGSDIPYLPVVELVKSGFGINDTDDDGAIIAKVDEDTSLWTPEAQKTVAYLKFLLQVDPGDDAVTHMDPMERRAGILDALRALILERAREAPRVVVVEDLHWADAQSEEAFRVCADVVASSPVLMILTFRPGYLHPSADLPHANRIVLNDLDAQARTQLAETTLAAASLSSDLAVPVTDKAEGNPLFIEEVAKALADGVTTPEAVPNSLQDVILARIDRLEAAARESLQLAAVIGREFTLRLLNRISDLHSELEGVLTELKVLELIYEKTFFPELAYMFKHALTHDVAYSTLLVERRKALHRVVAIAIEELYADRLAEHYETLAHHYSRAESWDKALEYLEKAAEKATTSFALEQAVDFNARAIKICEEIGDQPAIRRLLSIAEQQGIIGFAMGDLAASDAGFHLMAETAKRCGDSKVTALALADLSMVELYEHELDRAEATARSALDIESVDIDVVCSAGMTLWLVTLFTDRFDEARGYQEQVLNLGPRTTNQFVRAMTGVLIPLTREWVGDYRSALDEVSRIESKPDSAGDLFTLLFTRWAGAITLGCIGEYQKALEVLLEIVPMAERVGVLLMLTRGINTVGWVYGELHDFERALEWNRKGFDAAIAAGFPDPEIECNAAINIGDNLMALGRPDEAEEQFKWVEGIYHNPTPVQRFMLWRYSQHMLASYGGLWLARGDHKKALAYADECIELATRTDAPKNVVKGNVLRGQALAAAQRPGDAMAALDKAIGVARDIGNVGQLWRALAAKGDILASTDRSDEARSSYAEASAIIDRVAAGLIDDQLRETFLGSQRVVAIKGF